MKNIGIFLLAVLSLAGCDGRNRSSDHSCAGIEPGQMGFPCLTAASGGSCVCETWSVDCNGELLQYLFATTCGPSGICNATEVCPPH